MKRSTKRILTTHTGSLPRTPDLVEMLRAREAGTLDDLAAFQDRVRGAVGDVVGRQAEAGVDVISDGEQSKISYSTYVTSRLTGFDGESPARLLSDWEDFPESPLRRPGLMVLRPACTGPVSRKQQEEVGTDISNLAEAIGRVDVEEGFMTAASPGVIAMFLRNQYYPSREEYLYALADAMRPEYEAIHEAGLVLQVDCPDLAAGRHTEFAELSTEEFLKVAEGNVEALNHALANVPKDRVRLHLCWGNYEGPHHRDIPLREIIETALKANVSAISFEGANPRHEHEWVVFEDVRLPYDKVIIPGVIDSTTNFIEHPELVAQRIGRYAGLVGRENVIAGSDCGFGTAATENPVVDPSIVWHKLRSMAEGARLASGRLW